MGGESVREAGPAPLAGPARVRSPWRHGWSLAGPAPAGRPSHTETPWEYDITFLTAQSAITSTPLREPRKTLRQKGADSFHAALAAVLAGALEDALEQGDHPRAVAVVNRGFAEGSPQLGCELLCRAMTVVGAARTWTVQMRP